MTVAERIKQTREDLGMTQEELAKKMGYVGKSSVSKIEASGNNITLKKVSRVAEALGVNTTYLMGWEDEDPTEAEMDAKANYLWELYTNASPEVQSAVETLLKAAKHD